MTAIDDCKEGWLVLAACDAFLLDRTLPERLLSEIPNPARVIALKGTQWETTPVLYHCSILPVVSANIARNELALWRIIEQVPHKAIEYSTDEVPIAQINTQEDWKRYREKIIP